MKYQGRENAEWGFKNPTDGSFEVVIADEIEITTNSTSGKSSLKIPTRVVEGEFANANIFIFAPMDSDFGEQKVADIIGVVGLAQKFNDAFPGEISCFDAAVIKKMQAVLPGKYLTIKLEPYTSKDGKTYGNIVQISKSGTAHAAKTDAPKAKKEASVENWDD